MIFPHHLSISYAKSPRKVEFNAEDAISGIRVSDGTEQLMLPKVAAASQWMTGAVADHGEDSDLLRVHKEYDWTYGTDYSGTVEPSEAVRRAEDNEVIDWKLLANPADKILFFAECVLYEDELDDNGVTRCSVRIVS
jgi:type 2A phosphatase activator TIP41